MRISFFEEFPQPENLAPLRLVTWKTKLYLACPSIKEFSEVERSLDPHKKHIGEAVYWPVLKKKEGYWISPFSRQKALQRIFKELQKEVVPVLLDLELPTSQNVALFGTEFLHFAANKQLIQEFIASYYGEVYLAEYSPGNDNHEKLLEWLGLHFQNKNVYVVKMLYHSLHHFTEDSLRHQLEQGRKTFGKRYIPAFGTIARGVQGDEPLLSLAQLKKDLTIAREQRMKEVIIFRLGGLTKEYAHLLARFAD